ncbi:MAG: PAS domain S-box protein [Polyangiales bacterium]
MVDVAHLHTALEVVPMAAMLVGEDGRILRTNGKLEELFGYAKNELANQSVSMLVPKEDRAQHPSHVDSFVKRPSSRLMGGGELVGVTKGGKSIPIEVGLNPIETELGLRVVTTVVDIRERKHHEKRFKLALDAAPSAIIMVDSAGTIVLCNRLTEEVFGHPRAELIGQPIESLIPQRLHEAHVANRSGYVKVPERRKMGRGPDLWGLRADGTEFPVEVALQPITANDEQFVISSVLDISEQRSSARVLDAKNKLLTRLNEDLRAFAFSASHDLKAPLSSIQGLSECMAEDLAAGDLGEVGTNLNRINVLAEKLSTLVEDMLSVANADASAAPASFRVDEHVRLAIVRHSALAAQLRVEIDASAVEALALVSQAPRFDSIVDNLLSNALRYSDPNKQHREVRLSAERRDERFVLEVRDNGLGIPEGMREKVFRMFQRAHPHLPDGSGLGLALSRKHAQRMGGQLRLEILDGWTVFSLLLPSSILADVLP